MSTSETAATTDAAATSARRGNGPLGAAPGFDEIGFSRGIWTSARAGGEETSAFATIFGAGRGAGEGEGAGAGAAAAAAVVVGAEAAFFGRSRLRSASAASPAVWNRSS